jgi:hypothetical protein
MTNNYVLYKETYLAEQLTAVTKYRRALEKLLDTMFTGELLNVMVAEAQGPTKTNMVLDGEQVVTLKGYVHLYDLVKGTNN